MASVPGAERWGGNQGVQRGNMGGGVEEGNRAL